MQQMARLRGRIEPYEQLVAQAEECAEWLSLLQMEYDEATAREIAAQVEALKREVEKPRPAHLVERRV
jgi:hypothetical protein